MPLQIFYSRLCPKGLEGSMFSVLTSIVFFGSAMSTMTGNVYLSFFNLKKVVGPTPGGCVAFIRGAEFVKCIDYGNLKYAYALIPLYFVLLLPLLYCVNFPKAIESLEEYEKE